MGITLGIHNDLKYPVDFQIKFKGGSPLSLSAVVEPGETRKRTDRVLQTGSSYSDHSEIIASLLLLPCIPLSVFVAHGFVHMY